MASSSTLLAYALVGAAGFALGKSGWISPYVNDALDRVPQPPQQHGHTASTGDIDYRVVMGNINATAADLMKAEGHSFRKPLVLLVDQDRRGPFYDPPTGRIVMPDSFVAEIRRNTGCRPSNCLFVVFQVLSHETGHAMQDQIGLFAWDQGGPALELMADCISGSIAKAADTQMVREGKGHIIEPGDIESGLAFAGSIGGASHGSGPQRQAAFRRGWAGGTLATCTRAGGGRYAGG
jgi:predicted metalloprotease